MIRPFGNKISYSNILSYLIRLKGSQFCEPFSLIRYEDNKSERITYHGNEVRIYRTWQGYKDSNLGHLVLETNALPTELHPYIKAVLSIILNCSENVNTFCRKFYKILLALRSALSSHKKSSKTFSFYCAL